MEYSVVMKSLQMSGILNNRTLLHDFIYYTLKYNVTTVIRDFSLFINVHKNNSEYLDQLLYQNIMQSFLEMMIDGITQIADNMFLNSVWLDISIFV